MVICIEKSYLFSFEFDEGFATIQISHFSSLWLARCKKSILAMCYDKECHSLEAIFCKDAYLCDFQYGLSILDSKETASEHLSSLQRKLLAEEYDDLYEPRRMMMSIKATKFVLK